MKLVVVVLVAISSAIAIPTIPNAKEDTVILERRGGGDGKGDFLTPKWVVPQSQKADGSIKRTSIPHLPFPDQTNIVNNPDDSRSVDTTHDSDPSLKLTSILSSNPKMYPNVVIDKPRPKNRKLKAESHNLSLKKKTLDRETLKNNFKGTKLKWADGRQTGSMNWGPADGLEEPSCIPSHTSSENTITYD
ncbi:hypothetical protein BATDEDRAFT_22643 [Batrachochytrium dendrobatidis JAM81]|uniref:Secreted protein n=1 Tax=Batrachochytrium dendrobatidis (strain JAM81 / FGSC 10211) TaxID=684364 RepID=F4NX49_BATDJ|nr:uncharacterized protein BATDEDRAFT_22643 [Batrachochytrium dendrobatidis JAM81]EGF82296.1 hypothetical protein BATDEDRAFT_22643 [Batrachochytrium dendrobatidis JAM81]|eukprot:XP_006676590.1 hypothetical protein BATDEDRAFT_22643 [Batrachochytrium dendrobatidis JAM81]